MVPEAGIDRAVSCGKRSSPSGKLRDTFKNEGCTAYDRPQVAVWGCAHRAQSTRMTIRSGDFKSFYINIIENNQEQQRTPQNN